MPSSTVIRGGGFRPAAYGAMLLGTAFVFIISVCLGSVSVPLRDVFASVAAALSGEKQLLTGHSDIILSVRIPRVLCVALTGASLSLCGAAMQGILRNPLADGSTLGVSGGASLGAVLAISFGSRLPFFGGGGVVVTAIVFAFMSLAVILGLSHKLDRSLSTNTIILTGIVYSMFVSSIISLVIAFAGDKVKTITFWTMGSLANTDYLNVLTILTALLLCASLILMRGRELNAFALGEDNARSVGVNVKRVKLELLIAVSILIGVCVSIGGTIGFVGLVSPHMTRMLTGPNHKRLLSASMFFGACFLMLADLLSRTIVRPMELPVGVVTSFIGAVAFVFIFKKSGRVG